MVNPGRGARIRAQDLFRPRQVKLMYLVGSLSFFFGKFCSLFVCTQSSFQKPPRTQTLNALRESSQNPLPDPLCLTNQSLRHSLHLLRTLLNVVYGIMAHAKVTHFTVIEMGIHKALL
jgi:hypothetical protein